MDNAQRMPAAFLGHGSPMNAIGRNRYTDVQKKIDGRWQYIVDHPSDEPAAPAQ